MNWFERIQQEKAAQQHVAKKKMDMETYLQTQRQVSEADQIRKEYADEINPLEAFVLGIGRQMANYVHGGQELFYEAIGDDEALEDLRTTRRIHDATYNPAAEAHKIATGAGELVPPLATAAIGLPAGAPLWKTALFEGALGGGLGGLDYEQNVEEGAIGGALGGAGGHIAARTLFGAPIARETAQSHLDMLQKAEGNLRLTPFDITKNPAQEAIEAAQAANPWTSRPIAALRSQNQEAANRVAKKALGEIGSGPITNDVLIGAQTRISGGFEDILRDKVVPLDHRFVDDVRAIADDYTVAWGKNDKIKPYIDDALEAASSGQLGAQNYKFITSQLGGAIRAARRSGSKDAELIHGLVGLQSALNNAAVRGAGSEFDEPLKALNRQWRALKLLVRPGVLRSGEVNLPTLFRILKSEGGGVVKDKSELALYAELGDYFKNSIGDSGTATRSIAESTLQEAATIASASDPLSEAFFRGIPRLAGTPAASLYLRTGAGKGLGGVAEKAPNLSESVNRYLSRIFGRLGASEMYTGGGF